MKKYLLSLFILLISPGFTLAEESFHLTLSKSNKYYEQGQYKEARLGYLSLLDQGSENGHIHYNIGNTLYQEGSFGNAIFHYIKAQTRLPRDEDVAANLALALRKTTDIWDGRRDSPASAILFWLNDFNFQEHLQALVILNFLFWITTGIKLARPNESLGKTQSILLGILLIGVLSTGARWNLDYNTKIAVVGETSLDVFSAKGKTGEVVLQLHEGAILPVLDEKGDWIELELPNGKKGWVPQNALMM